MISVKMLSVFSKQSGILNAFRSVIHLNRTKLMQTPQQLSPLLNKIMFKSNNYSQSDGLLIVSKIYFSTSISCYKKDKYEKNSEKGKQQQEEIDEDEEDEEADDNDDDDEDQVDTSGFEKGFKVTTRHVSSLRFDAVLAAGLGMSRNSIDDLFYSSKLRLNGHKFAKKAVKLKDMDKLDLLTERDKDGKQLMKRVILYKIHEAKSKSNKPKVTLVSWRAMIKCDYE